MLEKVATAVIVSASSLLFIYWFRYACLLVLTAKPPRDYASIAETANQLRFRSVQTTLQQPVAADLDELRRLLDHDYQVLTYLLSRVVTGTDCFASIEKRMLELDYRVMRVWYIASSRFSRAAACRALDEMSCIVAHFANAMGERTMNAEYGIRDAT
jgi:hypothetical protein